MTPVGGLIGQPNLDELVRGSVGVTYYASAARAEAELGFAARSLDDGLRDLFAAADAGLVPA
jgi:nucleoside-diphosphate-sugar epimerase